MLIKNAKLADGREVDVLIESGKFVKIERNIESTDSEVIDIEGKYLLPGMIDVHTHMREPGLTHKEGFSSGSRACAKGGVTTFADMPNTNPPTITVEALKEKRELAKGTSIVDYALHFGGSVNNNSEEIKKAEGVISTKVFLNVSTGKLLVEDDNVLDDIFKASKIVSVHAEEHMIDKAISLAKKHGKKLYIAHISLATELDAVREAKKTFEDVYVEVTPHHLFLTEEDAKHNPLLRMKPELKAKSDVEAMWTGIADGTINTIGTDHAPHLMSEKIEKLTFGIPGVEWALALMLNAVNEGKISLGKVIELYSEIPAKIFGIKNKGEIKIGYDADFSIVDMDKNYTIKEEETVSKCAWTPYKNWEIKGQVLATYVRGQKVYEDNKFYANKGKEVELIG